MASTPFPAVDRHDVTIRDGLAVAAVTATDESGTSTGYTIDVPDEPLTGDDVNALVAVLRDITGTARRATSARVA